MLIEAVTGKDFRDVIRETVTEPLGLGRELFVGLPEASSAAPPTCMSRMPERQGMRRDRRRQLAPNGARAARRAARATARRAPWPRSTR